MFVKILLLSLVSFTAHAQISALSSYSGNGCPQGSVHSTTTDDGSIISVLFDSFTSQTDASKIYAYSNCQMNIAVNIPAGYRISSAQSVQNGFYSVPQGSWGRMMTEIYVRGAGNRTVMQKYSYKDFSNNFQDNVVLQTDAAGNTDFNCTERQQFLQIRSSILLWTAPKQTQFASGTIDSVDLTLNSLTPSTYTVLFEKCPAKPRPRPIPPRRPWNRYQLQ